MYAFLSINIFKELLKIHNTFKGLLYLRYNKHILF